MPLASLSPLAACLAQRWAEDRTASAVLRLALPHLVLLAGDAARRPRDAGLALVDAVRELVGRAARADVAAITAHGVAHGHALVAAMDMARAPMVDLLGAWDEAAAAFDYGTKPTPDGRDGAGHPWMPTLSGLHPHLPVDEAYVRLGGEPGGLAAQLVLLAVAGEAGYQRLVVTTALLASHLPLPDATVDTAIDTLVSARWLASEALPAGAGEPTTVLWVPDVMGTRVFRSAGVSAIR